MLIDVTYPGILGDKAPTANVGSFKANGWEGTLNWSDKIGKVSYHVGGTFTYTTNDLTKILRKTETMHGAPIN